MAYFLNICYVKFKFAYSLNHNDNGLNCRIST